MITDNVMTETVPSTSQEGSNNAPSGFILKLYQMVNGAPDEVISWTPAGDAFIIGSDLNRLESETLPQYFRHNRFQSLVRQLNFYSFRKINRERNVWIYKHKLFHRDHPEDLFQVRRRTCPGVDGRKQRFSRYSAQKLSKYDDEKMSDDESSLESNSADESEVVSRKRRGSLSSTSSTNSKRPRRLWQSDPQPVTVDTSILPVSPNSVFDAPKTLSLGLEEDELSATNKKNDRMEMMERSLVVSEVATKLEEFARKALKGRGLSRRGKSGVVTPPYGYSKSSVVSSRGLITYDDEYARGDETLSGIITDGEESIDSMTIPFQGIDDDDDTNSFDVVPIENFSKVQEIVQEIRCRASSSLFNGKVIDACADVAFFLMTTAPGEEASHCCEKVMKLLIASDRLATDFHSYRSALHFNGKITVTPTSLYDELPSKSLQHALESGSSKVDTLREFKIFAVNLIYKLIGKNGSFNMQQPLSVADSKALLHTADIWSKSVGRVA